jgi:hydroxymethylbilane synthase
VGTSSLRRRSQLLETGNGYTILPLRGNIDTRLRKLRDGEYDAVVLAMAGMLRAGLYDPSFIRPLDPDVLLPAPGQGALALQCRGDDQQTRGILASLNDPDTALCVSAERAVVAALEGDCHSPIAVLATLGGGRVQLRAAVGARDGVPPVLHASAAADPREPRAAVDQVVQSLAAAGVHDLLRGKP